MPKPKEIDPKTLEKRKRTMTVIGKITLFLFLTFIFISLCSDPVKVKKDYSFITIYLKNPTTSILDFFGEGRPEMTNPVGIFGVFTAYYLILWFGWWFSFISIALSLLHLFMKLASKKSYFINKLTIFLLNLVCNIYIFDFFVSKYYSSSYISNYSDRLFFNGIAYFIIAMLGKVGTPIFCIVALIASLRLFFTFNPVTILVSLCITAFKTIFTGWNFKLPFKKSLGDEPAHPVSISDDSNRPKSVIDDGNRSHSVGDDGNRPEPVIQEVNIHLGPGEIPRTINPEETPNPQDNYTPPVKYNTEQTQYQKPDIEQFLSKPSASRILDKEKLAIEVQGISQILIDKLAEFGLIATVLNVNIGPIITQYELQPAPGIRVKEFTARADDIALALRAESIRVQAPIPGRGLIGVEVPNRTADMIYMHDIFFSPEMINNTSLLTVALGKDIAGHPIVTDLAKMPHLLIAGATGAGKSVCINTIITSLLLRCDPEDVRLVMIDPKCVELSGYEDIPHLIQSVVTEPEDALNSLNWAVYEMERRYRLLQDFKVRDIMGYNQKIEEMTQENGEEVPDHLPYIVVIVDEFADLIMTAGKEIELPITKLAQKARAIGIHLILATQRPSIKVITGLIKANFPARIAFRVMSQIDSRVILDSTGAEKLLGRGDMLFLPPGKSNPERIHGAYLSDAEIEGLVDYLRTQPKPQLHIEMQKPEMTNLGEFVYDDDLFPEAVRVVVIANTASVSMLQRHFKIGYARAGRLIDLLEQAGVIGPHKGSKTRDVLMKKEDLT